MRTSWFLVAAKRLRSEYTGLGSCNLYVVYLCGVAAFIFNLISTKEGKDELDVVRRISEVTCREHVSASLMPRFISLFCRSR